MTKANRALGAALMLCGFLSTAAVAQNAPGQDQDKGQQPPADAKPAAPTECIAENDDFKMRGKSPVFEIALENKCEQRMRCKVFVYITSSRGPTQGQGTIVLAPKSKGAAAKGSYIIKTRENGGSAQSSRQCRVF